jgi:diguanylate cyclase (GGDEF)-like protein
MPGAILIVSPNVAVTNILRNALMVSGNVVIFTHLRSALDFIYNEIPNLLIVDIHADKETMGLLNNLKDDPLFASIPVLAILDERHPDPDWTTLLVEDYIREKDIQEDIHIRGQLCLLRSQRNVEINPLTRLPGNISINRQIQSRLDRRQAFSLGYVDLDHFKAFNDKYGFSRGDDVIKITGRLLLNIVKSKPSSSSFVGHIGGDDFIFIMDTPFIEETCQEVIDAFDRIMPTLYDPEDREAKAIHSPDREGNIKAYPIMGISIGVANTDSGTFFHYMEITGLAVEMKKYTKQRTGSCYEINRRVIPD